MSFTAASSAAEPHSQTKSWGCFRLRRDSAICWEESKNSSGYMCALCTLHPISHLKVKDWGPSHLHPGSAVIWGACWWNISLIFSYSFYWECLIDVLSSYFRYLWSPAWLKVCSLSAGSFCQHWEYTYFLRFHCLRWMRMRKMTFSRWRVEVKTTMSSLDLNLQLWCSLVWNGCC